jgi:hypothetical protein
MSIAVITCLLITCLFTNWRRCGGGVVAVAAFAVNGRPSAEWMCTKLVVFKVTHA